MITDADRDKAREIAGSSLCGHDPDCEQSDACHTLELLERIAAALAAARQAERERFKRIITEKRMWYSEEIFPERWTGAEAMAMSGHDQMLISSASAGMARHTCDHLLAAIDGADGG